MTDPLMELRRQGFDADLHQGRLRVWPRHKINKPLAQFVTANLPAISAALVAEDNIKAVGNVFVWTLPGDRNDRDAAAIPDYMNGEHFAGVTAPSV